MGYFLIGAGEILAFCKKHHRGILFILVMITWLIFAFNTDNPDLLNYRDQYYGVKIHYSEPLYVLLQKACMKFGISFRVFVAIEAALGLVLTATAISILSPYPNAVYGLYMIYPFFIDVVQVRTFLAQAFILLVVTRLLKYQKARDIKHVLCFTGLFFAALGFHYAAVFFAPLYILFLDKKRYKVLIYIIAPLCIVLIPFFVTFLTPLIVKVIGAHKTFLWIFVRLPRGMFGVVKMVGLRLVMPILICFLWKMVYPDYIECKSANPYYEENKTLFLAVIILFFFITMELFVDGQYNRISRTNYILECVLFSRLINLLKNKTNTRILWGVVLMFTILYMLDTIVFRSIPITGQTWFTAVFRKVFENNSIWNWWLR